MAKCILSIVTKFAIDFFGGTVVAGDLTLPNLVKTLAIGLACIDTLTYFKLVYIL